MASTHDSAVSPVQILVSIFAMSSSEWFAEESAEASDGSFEVAGK